ncbi:MAG TPA: hypothetical protein VFA89_02665 [Terriglobales bacterium]|nr:hypothetical protein [Terriglobales bacterium]
MIARCWRGETRNSDSEAYFEYLQETGVKQCKSIPGNRGVWLLRRLNQDAAEFWFISLWDSYESIKAFAGPDYEKAVYYPEDKRFLLSLDPHVTHYEVLNAVTQ